MTLTTDPTARRTPRATRAATSLVAMKMLFWAYCLIGVAAAAYFYREAIHWVVVGPLLAIFVVATGFILYLRSIEGKLPYFEIGAFYAAVTALYAAYPLLQYVLRGYDYPRGDYRMVALRFRPDTFGLMGWWYVLYLFCFCVAYVLVRGTRPVEGRFEVSRPDTTTIVSIVILLAAARMFFVVLGLFFDMSGSSYLDSYLVIQRLPLFVRQIAAQVQGIGLTLQIMFVIALTCAKRRSFRIILIVYLALTTLSHLIWPGGRIHLLALLIAAVAAHHLTVRRVPFRWAAVAAAAGFALLILLAALRSQAGTPYGHISDRFADHTEFEVIFGNAVDLKYLQHASGFFLDKPNLYWAGLFAFIPQQFLPIVKDTSGGWYARTYYLDYFQSGGGLAFGVLAEGVVGHGQSEMLWRGALVGIVFGLLHRLLGRRRLSLYGFIFYIWVTVWSYQTVRNGTFGMLVMVAYHVIAPFLAVAVLGFLLRRGRAATHGTLPRPLPAS
jgi:hypothetical protein